MHTVRGGIDPGGHRFRPRVVGVVEIWKDFLSVDGTLSSPGCADFKYKRQPISDWLVGLGFPHRAERYRPGGSALLSPGCWSCSDIEGFLIRGWNLSSPGAAEPWCCREGQLSPRAGSMSPIQSATSQWVLGFQILRGGIDPGDSVFVPGLLEL